MVKWRLYVEKWQGEHTIHLGFAVTTHSDESLTQAVQELLVDANIVRVTITRLGKD